MSADALTPESFKAQFAKTIEATARVLPTSIVLGPHDFEPLPGLDISLAEAFVHPECVPTPTPYVRPDPPVSLDELAVRDDWETTDCYCVHCGKQPVIVEVGDGDFYVGPQFHCLCCKGTFHLG